MKLKLFALAALLVAVASAYAFKAAPLKFSGTLFQLVPGGNPKIHPDYVPFTGTPNETLCPDENFVCVIDVPAADIYPASHPTYPSKPKVINTAAAGELADDIQTALTTTGEPTAGANGRLIYERFTK